MYHLTSDWILLIHDGIRLCDKGILCDPFDREECKQCLVDWLANLTRDRVPLRDSFFGSSPRRGREPSLGRRLAILIHEVFQ